MLCTSKAVARVDSGAGDKSPDKHGVNRTSRTWHKHTAWHEHLLWTGCGRGRCQCTCSIWWGMQLLPAQRHHVLNMERGATMRMQAGKPWSPLHKLPRPHWFAMPLPSAAMWKAIPVIHIIASVRERGQLPLLAKVLTTCWWRAAGPASATLQRRAADCPARSSNSVTPPALPPPWPRKQASPWAKSTSPPSANSSSRNNAAGRHGLWSSVQRPGSRAELRMAAEIRPAFTTASRSFRAGVRIKPVSWSGSAPESCGFPEKQSPAACRETRTRSGQIPV